MALAVLDASVAIAFLQSKDAHHSGAVTAFEEHRAHELVLPASAYSEALVEPFREGSDAVERAEQFVSDFGIRIEPVSREIAERAAELRASARLRLPDALVLATGDVLDADFVLTADAGWAKLSPRVKFV